MRHVITGAMLMAVVFGMASSASAAAVLRYSTDPAFVINVVSILDNGAGDLNGTVDVIQVNRPVGMPYEGFSFSASTGTTNEGAVTTNILLNVQDVDRAANATGGDTLYFQYTDNGIVLPAGGPGDFMPSSTSYSANDPLPLPTSVRFSSFADPGNAQFGTTATLAAYNCAFVISAGPPQTGSCSTNQLGGFTRGAAAYSLTQQIAVQLSLGNALGNASASTIVAVQPIPEPGSMLLLGSGLAAAASAARRRRAKKAQA